jgi:hypothetical protein
MKALDALDVHLKNRARELEEFKDKGRRIIGYYPGGYVPEEPQIIGALGAALLAREDDAQGSV